jgi:hypothetical protein
MNQTFNQLQVDLGAREGSFRGLSKDEIDPFQWKTIPEGAATSVWAGVVASADEIGGRYCENCHVGKTVPDDVTITAVNEGVRGYAFDANNAEALWKKSEELVGDPKPKSKPRIKTKNSKLKIKNPSGSC